MIAGQSVCQVIYKNLEQNGSKHRALRHTDFLDTFAIEVAAQFHSKSSVFLHPASYLEVDPQS